MNNATIITISIISGITFIILFINWVVKNSKEMEEYKEQTKEKQIRKNDNEKNIKQLENYITCEYCGCKYKKNKDILKCPNCNANKK